MLATLAALLISVTCGSVLAQTPNNVEIANCGEYKFGVSTFLARMIDRETHKEIYYDSRTYFISHFNGFTPIKVTETESTERKWVGEINSGEEDATIIRITNYSPSDQNNSVILEYLYADGSEKSVRCIKGHSLPVPQILVSGFN